ncbi:sensor domain-containing diguanylate cyclase [Mariprofundus ferrooxydans]|uniref:Hypothetical 918 kDa protein Y4LL n=1 Tax=Mariprofundus ferrooxydans PV-1 TaxID=314345 RepID=Q0EY34_9PROT|nr:sensor domain-containing diguanylate cyclase [Mariprofundus ferrooxydans]EAU54192.1 Hypothetical 918 kDa protein Y4LL [Mariprofundus ferrooxydans PV-1]KON47741.1 diguanylate cyclase [Mariprofundus ferrooxydans]
MWKKQPDNGEVARLPGNGATPDESAARLHTAGVGNQSDSLQAEQVRLLYSHLPVSIAISAMLAAILISIQSSVIDPVLLFGWFAILGAVLIGRTGLFIAWKRQASTTYPADTDRWLFRFRVGIVITGIVWGLGGILLSPARDIAHTIYISFTLAGLCAGAASTLAIDRKSLMGFIVPPLVSHAVFLAAEGDVIFLGLSAMILLFLMFLLFSGRQSELRFEENFNLRIKASENESRLLQILESSPIATRIADAASNRVVFANSCYENLIELPAGKVIGAKPSSYYAHPEEYTEVVKMLAGGGQVVNRQVEIRSPGSPQWTKWVLASYFPIEYQEKPAVLGWFYDITERKLMEDKVEYQAFYDTLTGLANRSLFHNTLHQAIANAKREKCSLALIFVDLDKFKPVNDQFGHGIGDLLLKAVADRITGCLRESDSAARIGGDEFVVLLPSVGVIKNALKIAEKVRHELNQPFEIEGLTLNISSSNGVALYPDHADDAEQLIKRADIAMYYAKTEGKNSVKAYRPEMSAQTNQEL